MSIITCHICTSFGAYLHSKMLFRIIKFCLVSSEVQENKLYSYYQDWGHFNDQETERTKSTSVQHNCVRHGSRHAAAESSTPGSYFDLGVHSAPVYSHSHGNKAHHYHCTV